MTCSVCLSYNVKSLSMYISLFLYIYFSFSLPPFLSLLHSLYLSYFSLSLFISLSFFSTKNLNEAYSKGTNYLDQLFWRSYVSDSQTERHPSTFYDINIVSSFTFILTFNYNYLWLIKNLYI